MILRMGGTVHSHASAPKPVSAPVSPAPLGESGAGTKRARWYIGDRVAIAVATGMGLAGSAALAAAATAVARSN